MTSLDYVDSVFKTEVLPAVGEQTTALTMPSGANAGDFLVAWVDRGFSTETNPSPPGWSGVIVAENAELFIRVATGSEAGSYDFPVNTFIEWPADHVVALYAVTLDPDVELIPLIGTNDWGSDTEEPPPATITFVDSGGDHDRIVAAAWGLGDTAQSPSLSVGDDLTSRGSASQDYGSATWKIRLGDALSPVLGGHTISATETASSGPVQVRGLFLRFFENTTTPPPPTGQLPYWGVPIATGA